MNCKKNRIILVVFTMILTSCISNQKNTDDILAQVISEPSCGWQSMRPGWTSITYPEEYRKYERPIVIRLITYLSSEHESDNENVRHSPGLTKRGKLLMVTAQLASDLNVKEAIPFLVNELDKIVPDEDTILGSCLIAKLVELTQIENGYRFHRGWFNKEMQAKAVQALKVWLKDNGY